MISDVHDFFLEKYAILQKIATDLFYFKLYVKYSNIFLNLEF